MINQTEWWLARDVDGELYLFFAKPTKGETIFSTEDNWGYANLRKEMFPEVTWDNSPVKVTLSSASSSKIEYGMRPFDLEEAQAGAKLCTRDGCPARIIFWELNDAMYPIAAAVATEPNHEYVYAYSYKGELFAGAENGQDLMMAPKVQVGWINVYKDKKCSPTLEEGAYQYYDATSASPIVYDSEEQAKKYINTHYGKYLATVPIEWSE